MSKRELVQPGPRDKRRIRRDERNSIDDQGDVGRSFVQARCKPASAPVQGRPEGNAGSKAARSAGSPCIRTASPGCSKVDSKQNQPSAQSSRGGSFPSDSVVTWTGED
jgi:hypothetical protein